MKCSAGQVDVTCLPSINLVSSGACLVGVESEASSPRQQSLSFDHDERDTSTDILGMKYYQNGQYPEE